jgi:hypothetical protein
MISRSFALLTAAAFALLAHGSAQAAPTTVQLRIEGSTTTLFEGPVTTDGHAIDKGDGPHPCDGTNANANPTPGPTMTSALDDWSRSGGLSWSGTWFSFGDFAIDRIGPDAAQPDGPFWGYALNFVSSQVGGCQQRVNAQDEVLFAYDYFSKAHLLRLVGPARAVVGQPFQVTVTDGQTGSTIDGANVTGGSGLTDAAGHVTVTLGAAGLDSLKAERSDSVRSNRVQVCASASGTGDCGVPPAQFGTQPGTPGAGKVKDSVAPRVRIAGPRDGARYRRGPRLLRGTAADDVGVTRVKLALRRHAHGEKCRWWSGSRERFTGSGCARKVFFQIGAATNWSYLLPRRLPPGRYVLDVKAFDRARNSDERFVRGSNRVVFYVGRAYAKGSAASSRSKRAPVVVGVAGKSKTWSGAVHAPATLVEVGGRPCKVGASTPLAALVAFLRKQRTGYLIHDYGSCTRTNAAAAGQLFVRRIGEDANKGSDGWFYKLNDRAPELGAGDPAARVHPGDRLLWFYCVFDERARSCQRSLRIVPVSGSTSQNLRVTVRGYDNPGHWVPVAGATVAIGPLTTSSGADGDAALRPGGGPGRYGVTAKKSGMIDAFPVIVTVK